MPDFLCPECKSNLTFKDNTWFCLFHGKVEQDHLFVSKRLFISYGHDEHLSLAERIDQDLKLRGHQTWFDKDRLKAGSDWETRIENGFNWLTNDKQNSAIILLLTPHSVRRPNGYCLNEITRGLSRGITIIPLMVIDSEPPLSICRIQWLDMRECIPISEKEAVYVPRFKRLLSAIEENKLDFEGNQQRLIKVLQPQEFDAEIHSHFPKFIGRKWIFDKITAWLNNDNNIGRIFWIIGSPGVGKTAISAILSAHFQEIAAMHLCKFGHTFKGDPRRVVTSLAYQLSTQLPDYESLLAKMADLEELVKSDASTIFDNLILQPLHKIKPPERIIIILIDALDEAIIDVKSNYNILASFIATQFPKTPNWIRLIITSRPESAVMLPLQGIKPFNIDNEIIENRNDIREYLSRELVNLIKERKDADLIIDHLIKNSEGIFLYVEHICKEIIQGEISLDNLKSFPKSLGEVFLCFFDRLVWVDKNNPHPDYDLYNSNYRPILRAILSAYAPLPLSVLQTVLSKPFDEMVVLIQSLSSLFPVSEENGIPVIKPYHKLIIEWLIDYKSAGKYFINIDEGKSLLTDALWDEFRNRQNAKISNYCYNFLPLHLKEKGRWNDLIEIIKSPSFRLLKRWIDEGEATNGIECLEEICSYLLINKKELDTLAALASQLAQLLSNKADYKKSDYWIRQSVKYTSVFKGRRIRAIAFHELGSLSLYNRNYQVSKRYFQRALWLCNLGLKKYYDEAASNLIGLATVAKEKDDHFKLLSLANRASKLAVKAKDIDRLVVAERLKGNAYKSLGNYNEAEQHLKLSLNMSDFIKSRREKYRTQLVLGYLEYDISILKNTSTQYASKLIEEAFEGARFLNDSFHYIEAMLSIGMLKLKENHLSLAEQIFFEVKEKLEIHEHRGLMAILNLYLACIDHRRGDNEKAKQAYQDVVNFCTVNKLNSSLCRALIGIGAINYHEKKLIDAGKTWKKAIKIAASISKHKLALAEATIELCKQNPTEIAI